MRKIVLAMALAAGACVRTMSQSPLSPPDDGRPDPSLVGVWTIQEEEQQSVVVIVSTGEGAWVEAIGITYKPEGRDSPWMIYNASAEGWPSRWEVGRCQAFPTVLGGQKYLNARCSESNSLKIPATADFDIVRYDVKRDTLRLRAMRSGLIEAAIRGGLLSAYDPLMCRSRLDDEIHLTASSEQLARFVASADDVELFEKVPIVVMRRVPLPPPLPARKPAAQPSKKGP